MNLPSRNMSVELRNSTYIAANITGQSLDRLPGSVVRLINVPAYRLSIDCHTAVPPDLRIIYHTGEEFTTSILPQFDAKEGGKYHLISRYSGTVSEIGGSQLYTWVFSAFGAQGVYLGVMTPYNLTNETGPSTLYGNTKYRAFNMTKSYLSSAAQEQNLFFSYRNTQSLFGLYCSLW